MIARLFLLGSLVGASAWAQCPSYTASSPNNASCAVEAAAGTNPTVAQWQPIFDLVARGPAAWGPQAPAVPNLTVGCNTPTRPVSVTARFPCELLRGIAMQESSWRQFCAPTAPADQAGRSSQTLITQDCGYGIGQVTSGMRLGESPNFDRSRVASDPLYNLQAGMQLFSEKWRITECVGDAQAEIIEHWYSATWAYNGLATKNNPNNPALSTTRGVCRPGTACGTVPYQERVWGWLEFPPTANHWRSTRLAYPRLSDIGAGASRPPALPDPSCATPTNCQQTRPLTITGCFDAGLPSPDAGLVRPDAGLDGGSPTEDAGVDPEDGGLSTPIVLGVLPRTYRVPAGCGCQGGGAGLLALALSVTLLRGSGRRSGKNQ